MSRKVLCYNGTLRSLTYQGIWHRISGPPASPASHGYRTICEVLVMGVKPSCFALSLCAFLASHRYLTTFRQPFCEAMKRGVAPHCSYVIHFLPLSGPFEAEPLHHPLLLFPFPSPFGEPLALGGSVLPLSLPLAWPFASPALPRFFFFTWPWSVLWF